MSTYDKDMMAQAAKLRKEFPNVMTRPAWVKRKLDALQKKQNFNARITGQNPKADAPNKGIRGRGL